MGRIKFLSKQEEKHDVKILQTAEVNQYTKGNYNVKNAQQKNDYTINNKLQLTKPTNNEPTTFFETDYFPFEKKPGPVSFEPRTIAVRRIRYLQAKCAADTKKFGCSMN